MLRHSKLLASGLFLGLTVAAMSASAAEKIPGDIAKALADSSRPDADTARDAKRKPGETLAFAGVKKGEQIADLMPAADISPGSSARSPGLKGMSMLYSRAELRKNRPPA